MASAADFWNALKDGNHLVLMRHALAPGTGDPSHFALRDCSTQRNLSDQGRAQAGRIGEAFMNAGITSAAVYSSQWCRCLETAEGLALGPLTELPTVNSFFRRFERRGPQTDALRSWIAGADLSRPTVIVTHQVNISALMDTFTQSGEMILVRRGTDGTLTIAGRLAID